MKMILIGGIIGFFIIIVSFKSIKGKIARRDMTCNISITFQSKTISLKAIIDTGNFLKEPITRKPVIIVEKEALKGLIPVDILENLQEVISGKIEIKKEYISKIRLIPFSALGVENGLLLGVKPDNFMINYQEKTINNKEVIIGIYDKRLSKTNKYNALVGLDIIDKNDNVKSSMKK